VRIREATGVIVASLFFSGCSMGFVTAGPYCSATAGSFGPSKIIIKCAGDPILDSDEYKQLQDYYDCSAGPCLPDPENVYEVPTNPGSIVMEGGEVKSILDWAAAALTWIATKLWSPV
jgi:hypothetical protein